MVEGSRAQVPQCVGRVLLRRGPEHDYPPVAVDRHLRDDAELVVERGEPASGVDPEDDLAGAGGNRTGPDPVASDGTRTASARAQHDDDRNDDGPRCSAHDSSTSLVGGRFPDSTVAPVSLPSEPEIADSLLDLVGKTPMVRLGRIGADLECDLVAKVETFNPGGSVKDRPAVAMIDAAERDGLLKPGGTIVEPTSGNTGVGLAIVAAQRGYQCIFVMSDKMSPEKVALLRAYGAEVVVCPTAVPPEHPDSYYSVADRLTRETPNAFRPDQYSNPNNPAEHERSTGPEIWHQTAGRITHFVAGVGTGGTITGVARYLKRMNPDVQIIGADPEGSVYSGGTGRPYLVEGVGEDFWPTTFDPSLVDRTVMVSDADSFLTARRVTREEGLLIGGSCGTAVHAALTVGAELGPEAMVVVLLPDSGRGYLSKIFNDDWMMDFGFIRCEGDCAGDVLAAKGGEIPALVLVKPDEPARNAWALMRDLGVSQVIVSVSTELPLAAKEVSGMLDELSLMELAFREGDALDRPAAELMSPAMPMVGIGEPVARLVEHLDRSSTLLVIDGGHPIGVLSRSDVLGYLAAKGGPR
ncbi:MAG: cystathionine beta-synthase [Acidimicrobiia bacterium]|nr:cystathionine beta-synthase [Acidimicrobiia bacterium]